MVVTELPSATDVTIPGDGDEGEPRSFRIAGGEAIVLSHRAPGKESPNEDAAALVPIDGERGVLVVADGVGGHASGDKASRLAIDAVVRAVKAAVQEKQEMRAGILRGIDDANQAILALGTGAATTVAVVEIEKGTARSFHVGDSMALVTGQRGKIKLQTVSHSPVGYAVESGFLHEDDAVHHDERHIVSNLVGTADMRVEVGSPIRLARRDTVIVASDGLFDNFYVEEIVERVRKGPLERVARALHAEARRRMEDEDSKLPGKPDDLTFVVYRPGRTAR